MGKNERQKISYIIDKNDDDEKEIYLKELGESVHDYIKTGVKNTQLDNLIELEAVFRQKYEERFNVKEIAELISQSSVESMLKIEESHLRERKKKEQEIDIKNYFDIIKEVAIQSVYDSLLDKLKKIVKDTAYLSHVNMLYELYEQEERLRREEAEYEKIAEQFQKMADITKSLIKERRMKIERLQQQVDISEKELDNLLNRCEKYFNIRKKKEGIQISLSPIGKKYYDYIMNSQQKYSRNTLEKLVYKNCDKLMESIENSYNRGLEFDLHLEELSPERDRAIQSKYHRLTKRFISEYEEIYTANAYIINEDKERVYNEKNRIRIPRQWD